MHFVEGPQERAFLVGVEFVRGEHLLSVDESLAELARLAETAGLMVVGQASQRLNHPNSATYIGQGKLEEVKAVASELDADLILFDDELRPRHQRELEKYFGDDMRVLDRTALILDIFCLTCRYARRQIAGRASPTRISSATAHPNVDPPGASGWRPGRWIGWRRGLARARRNSVGS